MSLYNKLKEYIDLIVNDESNIEELIKDKNKFVQCDWDKLVEKYENIPQIVANEFIVRKEDLGNKVGIDLMTIIYNQKYPEEFFNQNYIKDLLDIEEEKYEELMGEYIGLKKYNDLWHNLFYCNQWYFSEKFILENAEHFINFPYSFQRYQKVPIEFYDKYINDERFTYINTSDQDIPVDFIKKHIRKHYKKCYIDKISNIQGLTEELFVEFINYPELKDVDVQIDLWNNVGGFNISEEFINKNIHNINKYYLPSKSPWKYILSNDISYSDELIERNIVYIDSKLLFNNSSNMQYAETFILKYWDLKGVQIKDVLNQKNIINMDNFIEKLLSNNKITFDDINKSTNISLNIIEKYHNELDFNCICYYNTNITISFFIEKILIWYPAFVIDPLEYLNIENASENTIKYFINNYYKKHDNENINLFYEFVNDIIKVDSSCYSVELINLIKSYHTSKTNSKIDMTQMASLSDPNILYNFSLTNILQKKNMNY
jgi:hypothetical protein